MVLAKSIKELNSHLLDHLEQAIAELVTTYRIEIDLIISITLAMEL